MQNRQLHLLIKKTIRKCAGCSSYSTVLNFEDIPKPKGLPFVGTTFSLLAAGGPSKLHKYMDMRHKELGDIFKENVGPVTAVFLSDPEEMRAVFANEGKYPLHIKPGSWLLYNEKYGYSRGLFFMDGEEWLNFRRIMNKLLLKGDLSWIDESCDVASDLLFNRIDTNGSDEFPDLEKELYKWSMDVIVSVLVGAKTYKESHMQVDHLVRRLASTVHLVFETTVDLQLIPAKFAERYLLRRWKKFENAITIALQSAKDIVDYINDNFKESDGLLEKMRQENVTQNDINRIIVDLILGAGDTTAYTMAWILYLVSKNKTVQSTLREELIKHDKTPLLRNVVRETLRLYPVAPFLTRFIPETMTLCGYTVPSNSLIVMSIYTSGRSEKYFKDPDLFMPDRWLRSSGQEGAVQQASLPFGIGARSCIGRKIADAQLQITLAKLVKKFEIELCNTTDVDDILKMITIPSQALRLKFNNV